MGIISANEAVQSADKRVLVIVFSTLQVSFAAKSVQATTAAPTGDAKPAAAAPVKTEAPATSHELTPDMTSDNPLETHNLAFYTQKISEGIYCSVLISKYTFGILQHQDNEIPRRLTN